MLAGKNYVLSVCVMMMPFIGSAFAKDCVPTEGNYNPDAKKSAWMDAGKDAVRDKLKDPSSAQFRNVFFCKASAKVPPVTCGEVNSKNSFGGFNGFQKFVSGGSGDMTFLQEEVSDFRYLWNNACVSKSR